MLRRELAREHRFDGSSWTCNEPEKRHRGCTAIWHERPDTSILFWSNYADEANVRGIARIVPDGAAYGYILKSASDERLRLALRAIFVESQCMIDREIRGLQQRSLGAARGFTDSEYEILVDIALGLTDRAIASRRHLSLRSVQNRLQSSTRSSASTNRRRDARRGLVQPRARAVTVAFLRKLLNHAALEGRRPNCRG